MNQKQAAAALGISDRALRMWMTEPGFPDCSSGYDVDIIRQWRDERNRKGSETSDQLQKLRVAMAAQKLRHQKAVADRKEREEEMALGNILPRDELEVALREIIQLTRDEMLALPQLLSRLVPKKHQAKVLAECKKEVEKRMTAFARRVERVEDDLND
jgi:hypothetical protein